MDVVTDDGCSKHFEKADEKYLYLKQLWERDSWVLEKREGGTTVESCKPDNGEGFWLKVTALFEGADYENLIDILDTHLEARQKEWHHLLLEGAIVGKVDDTKEVCWFAYSSPWPMKGRDCVYAKYTQKTTDKEGIFLSYYTVEDDNLKAAVEKYVRIDFEAAHWVTKEEDGKVRYSYVQKSDPKVPILPNFFLKGPQVGILIEEVAGLRKAVQNPIKPH